MLTQAAPQARWESHVVRRVAAAVEGRRGARATLVNPLVSLGFHRWVTSRKGFSYLKQSFF
jgi:hypothetical protein